MEHKHHITINSLMLFQLNPKLACGYALWIYLYLRLKYNLSQQESELCYRVDAKEIAEFFNINKATVFEALTLLEQIGLIIRQGRGFYSIDGDQDAVSTIKELCESEGLVPENYNLPIYNDFFTDFFSLGGKPKELEVYYFLVDQNHHFTTEKAFLELNITQKQVCDALRIDHRAYKRCVENLIGYGLLVKDEVGKLLTKSPNSELIPVELYEPIGAETTTEFEMCESVG